MFRSFLQVSAETLFGNVPSLIRAHRSFWEEVLGPTLEETRASGQPLDPVSLQNGFLSVRRGEGPHLNGAGLGEPQGVLSAGMLIPLASCHDSRGSKGTTPTPKYHLTSYLHSTSMTSVPKALWASGAPRGQLSQGRATPKFSSTMKSYVRDRGPLTSSRGLSDLSLRGLGGGDVKGHRVPRA